MDKPKMNYSEYHDIRVLADPSYGPVATCKGCGTNANLDEGLCEACYHIKPLGKQNRKQ